MRIDRSLELPPAEDTGSLRGDLAALIRCIADAPRRGGVTRPPPASRPLAVRCSQASNA
jgi:hypothetical protein